MNATKVSISLPADMYEQAKARSKKMRYKKFSQYVTYLVEQDLGDRPSHVRSEPPDGGPKPGKSSQPKPHALSPKKIQQQ